MELVDFILNMEGIKDFYSASKMTDEIMEEIVENAISASEASGSSCASSPSTGEVLHCPDTPCGQDSNYSKKNRSIKSVVSKAKDPSTKSSFLPPCRVCGDNASGFHYGANTCEACKVSVGCREWLYIYMKMKSSNDFFSNDFTKITKKKNNENKKVSIFYSNYFLRMILIHSRGCCCGRNSVK